jgi:hypothetical protein
MPALHTHPQMNPRTADLQTILTALRRRLHLMNMVQMSTLHRNTFLSSKFYSLLPMRHPIQRRQTFHNVISTEAAHSLIVSSAAEKSAVCF